MLFRSMLEEIVQKVPAPSGDLKAPLKALIFDSVYDDYRGVVLSLRVFDGTVKSGDKVRLMDHLLGDGGQPLHAAQEDDAADTHGYIVDNHCKLISPRAIAASHHEVSAMFAQIHSLLSVQSVVKIDINIRDTNSCRMFALRLLGVARHILRSACAGIDNPSVALIDRKSVV